MKVIRLHKHLESETLYLPELKPLMGKNVEIIVREETPTVPGRCPYDALFALARQDVVDPDAYKQLRAASIYSLVGARAGTTHQRSGRRASPRRAGTYSEW
jgi:hypothetical protein